MPKDLGQLLIHHLPPRVLLRSTRKHVVIERLHALRRIVVAVIKDEHVCVVNAKVCHDFFRGCGPTVYYHGNNGLERGLQFSWARFDMPLSVGMGEVPGCLGVRIGQLGYTLFCRIVGVVVLYRVQKSNDRIDIVASGEDLNRHDCWYFEEISCRIASVDVCKQVHGEQVDKMAATFGLK